MEQENKNATEAKSNAVDTTDDDEILNNNNAATIEQPSTSKGCLNRENANDASKIIGKTVQDFPLDLSMKTDTYKKRKWSEMLLNKATSEDTYKKGDIDLMQVECTKSISNYDDIPSTSAKQLRHGKSVPIEMQQQQQQQQRQPQKASIQQCQKELTNKSTKYNFADIFGVKCVPCLKDNCENEHCTLLNQFPHPSTVIEIVKDLPVATLKGAYDFMHSSKRLHQIYFKHFCQVYRWRGNRTKLFNMVSDCVRYPDYSIQLYNVYMALRQCGLSKEDACTSMLKQLRFVTSVSMTSSIVTIIMDADWTSFADYLERYVLNNPHYNFPLGVVNRMTDDVASFLQDPQMKRVFIQCAQRMGPDRAVFLLHCFYKFHNNV